MTDNGHITLDLVPKCRRISVGMRGLNFEEANGQEQKPVYVLLVS